MNAQWMICCRGASLDKESGNLSLFELLDTVNAPMFPLFVQDMVVAVKFTKSGKEKSGNCRIVIEQGKVNLFDKEITVDFGEKPNAHLIARLRGLVVPQAGEVQFKAESEKRKQLAKYVIQAVNVAGDTVLAIEEAMRESDHHHRKPRIRGQKRLTKRSIRLQSP
jgi:hypothetical protein